MTSTSTGPSWKSSSKPGAIYSASERGFGSIFRSTTSRPAIRPAHRLDRAPDEDTLRPLRTCSPSELCSSMLKRRPQAGHRFGAMCTTLCDALDLIATWEPIVSATTLGRNTISSRPIISRASFGMWRKAACCKVTTTFRMTFGNSSIVKSSRIWNTSGSVELRPWQAIHLSTSLMSCLVKSQLDIQHWSLQK